MDALGTEELRVLGSLVEKEATVPDTYPMTLKGLRAACNQSSNRDPVLELDEVSVQRALDALKARRLVRFVHPASGERATKFRHVLDEALDLDGAALALMAVLVLRGPQTPGELRTRTERLHAFASLDEVESTLDELARRPDPLAVELPRRPGDRQARWSHLLGGGPDVTGAAAGVGAARRVHEASSPDRAGVLAPGVAPADAMAGGVDVDDGAVASAAGRPVPADPWADAADDEVVAEVAALRAQVAELAARLARIEGELGLGADRST